MCATAALCSVVTATRALLAEARAVSQRQQLCKLNSFHTVTACVFPHLSLSKSVSMRGALSTTNATLQCYSLTHVYETVCYYYVRMKLYVCVQQCTDQTGGS
jgi:hypothetical protein